MCDFYRVCGSYTLFRHLVDVLCAYGVHLQGGRPRDQAKRVHTYALKKRYSSAVAELPDVWHYEIDDRTYRHDIRML